MILVSNQRLPAIVTQVHSPQEPASPVVAGRHAIFVFQQQRHVHLILPERVGNVIPVPHQERQDVSCFVQAGNLTGVRHLAATHLGQVFAGQHDLGARDQGGKKPIELLDIHGLAALAASQKFLETFQFRFRQRFVLGEDSH